MSAINTITRVEIAKLLGISATKLINVITYTNVEVPEPLGKVGKELVYDRDIMLAWIASDPLKNITWQRRTKKDPVAPEIAALPLAFLSGGIGLSTAQRNRNQLRKIAAKHAPRQTQRVSVSGNDDYTGSRDSWAGLV